MSVKFETFITSRLFDIHPTKAYKFSNTDIYKTAGTTPVLSNSGINNGIGGYSGLPATECGNIITFSDTTSGTNTMFYQPNPFIGYPHVQGLYPYDKEHWSERECLYFIGVMKNVCGKGWSYSNKFTRVFVSNTTPKLPIQTDDKGDAIIDKTCFYHDDGYIPDFDYMRERIEELERERIEELERYLIASGLNDYKLTAEDVKTLSLSRFRDYKESDNKIDYRTFKIMDLFNVYSPKKKYNANSVKINADSIGHPYIVRSSINNGIRGYIEEDEDNLNCGNTFTFGQDTATIFWQQEPYFTGDKIKILEPKFECNENIAQFIASRISISFQNYSWGAQSFSEKAIKENSIYLPVEKDDGDIPDWNYMEKYIMAIKKQVVADVVKFKNKKIDAVKALIK